MPPGSLRTTAMPSSKPPAKPANRPPPRVRSEPPTIDEAVHAALGLADNEEQQLAIAAGLMGVSEDEVREPLLAARLAEAEAPPPRPAAPARDVFAGRDMSPGRRQPVVVVERRRSLGVAPAGRVSLRPREPRR